MRAARAFVGWTARALATKAAVRTFKVEWIEGEGKITAKDLRDLAAIQATLEEGGIEFTNNDGVPGVRLHPSNKKQKRGRPSKRSPTLPINARQGRCVLRSARPTSDDIDQTGRLAKPAQLTPLHRQ